MRIIDCISYRFHGKKRSGLAIISCLAIVFSIYFSGCVREYNPGNSYFNISKADYYFDKIEAGCYNHEGELWGDNIFGPLMFVDREQRMVYSNFPDRNGNLRKNEGVFTGSYPRDLIINRDSLTFGGTQFALAALPSIEDEFTIIARGIRSLYYFYQHYFGYKPLPYNTSHMDERNARLWLKLEWRALKQAILAEGDEQTVALRDALIFRGSNHELYSVYVNDQIRYENYEGMAVFTYLLLGTESDEEFEEKLLELLDNTYSFSSYAKTYGSIHGALYATLAYRKGFDFSAITSAETDLGEIVRDLYDIQLPEFCRDVAGSIALNYNLSDVLEEEVIRDGEIAEQIKSLTNIFTDEPVVSIDLESPYFDFEPIDVVPVEQMGTIYNKLDISDNWGKLMVENGGCLVSNNFRNLKLPAENTKTDRTHIYGEGWTLTLNSNWELIKTEQNYFVRRTAY